MSVSLQNFHYFPPFCMLPQADELDANYYSENGQGTVCVSSMDAGIMQQFFLSSKDNHITSISRVMHCHHALPPICHEVCDGQSSP